MNPRFETIVYQKEEHIAKITLNRPEARNAITGQMSGEINSALLEAKKDDDVRAVIVTGAGKAFCSGIDLKAFYGWTGLENRDFLLRFYREMTDIQQDLGKPTIAALNGSTLAAGCSLAFSCDVVMASENARIGYPEINVGLIAAMHVVMVPRLIGRHRAFELLLSGDMITARQAADLGLINRVVPADSLEKAARDLALKFASKSPLVVRFYKDNFYRLQDMEYRKALTSIVDASAVMVASEDTKEGMKAFAEKRTPVWKGK